MEKSPRHQVTIELHPADYRIIQKASKLRQMDMASFIILQSFKAARSDVQQKREGRDLLNGRI